MAGTFAASCCTPFSMRSDRSAAPTAAYRPLTAFEPWKATKAIPSPTNMALEATGRDVPSVWADRDLTAAKPRAPDLAEATPEESEHQQGQCDPRREDREQDRAGRRPARRRGDRQDPAEERTRAETADAIHEAEGEGRRGRFAADPA